MVADSPTCEASDQYLTTLLFVHAISRCHFLLAPVVQVSAHDGCGAVLHQSNGHNVDWLAHEPRRWDNVAHPRPLEVRMGIRSTLVQRLINAPLPQRTSARIIVVRVDPARGRPT